MCGISGIFRFDGRPVEASVLERMKQSTVHRGPDDEGTLLAGSVGLAHNRLAILDLSEHGHQPMADETVGNWIVYNGEIYNFQDIRRELEAKGYRFRSTGDTEVILYAYREWGSACLERLNGMFAFVIFNERERTLFAARDRLGIKPLYYYVDDKQFVFASETKAILLADGVPRRIRRAALPEFVAFRYLANGRTLFEDIHELRPGHFIEVAREGYRVRQYWDIPVGAEDRGSDNHRLEGLHDQLKRSVASQLISDVPVGCALSGGVDSSLVTALACEASISTMKTFTIGFDLGAWDERGYAQQVSDILSVENYSHVLTADEFWGRLPKLIWHMDEPINHPNSVGIWMLAKLARQKVTVLLTGEGGDELMAGYGRFRTVLKFRRLRQMIPGSGAAARRLPSGMSGRKGRLVRELARDDDGLMIWSSAYLPSPYLAALFGPDGVDQAEAERREVLRAAPTANLISRHLYLEQKTYLASLLIRNDKMLMAESLEGRVPFLDHRVVEYAWAMPAELKVNRSQGKIALFELAGRRLGAELFDRPKSGFGVPTSYFHGLGLKYLRELVLSRSFRQRELMDPRAVESLLQTHESGEADLAEGVWILAALELWARTFIDQPGVVAA